MKTFRAMLLSLSLALLTVVARGEALWEESPYTVGVEVDASLSGLSPEQTSRLETELRQRITWRLGVYWRLVEGDEASPPDKQFELEVVAHGSGYAVHAVEHDAALDSRSSAYESLAASAADLPERLYSAMLAAFRPVATLQRDTGDAGGVALTYRGARLAPQGVAAMAKEGALLLPYRRTLSREGAVTAVQAVPWTYLVAAPTGEEAALPSAKVVSHTRRPFGARPGARSELLAITTPADPSRVTTLRLHALGDPATPLVGYEVSLAKPGDMGLEPLGPTDEGGSIRLPKRTGVWMAHVRCGDLVVASLPVAPGVAEDVAVALIDERSRLRAELEMTSLREELIDTVARRKILAERIRRLADNQQIDAAKKLLGEVEDLPGKTVFERRLAAARRAAKGSHPVAEARLDRLFEKTGKVLSGALDPRETRDLAIFVDRAAQNAELDSEESQTPTSDASPDNELSQDGQ